MNAKQVFEALGIDHKKYKTHQAMVLRLHREGKIAGVRTLGRQLMFTAESVERFKSTCGVAAFTPPRKRRTPRKAKSLATRSV